eukprot:5233528-Amphidinium_carterae.2
MKERIYEYVRQLEKKWANIRSMAWREYCESAFEKGSTALQYTRGTRTEDPDPGMHEPSVGVTKASALQVLWRLM